jgi:type II secretory pathway pseudopilin PulG
MKNNTKGMSLLGTLASVAVLGVVIYTSMTVFTNNVLQQKYVEQRYSVMNLHREIYEQLTNSQSCTATFTALGQVLNRNNIDNPPVEEFTSVTSIKSPDGLTDVFKKYVAVGDPTYENNTVQIQGFNVKGYQDQGFDANNRYTATAMLEVTYKQNVRTIGSEVFRPKQMKLKFVFRKVPAPDAANDKEVYTCSAIGGAGDSFWNLTAAADGIFYSAGRVGIGTTTPANVLEVVQGTSGRGISATKYGQVGARGGAVEVRGSNGTQALPTALLANDWLGWFYGAGHNGVGFTAPASPTSLAIRATENWNVANNGSKLVFHTTPNGSTAAVERMTIQENGNVGVGVAAPMAKLDVLEPNSGAIAVRANQTGAAIGNGAAVYGSSTNSYGIYGTSGGSAALYGRALNAAATPFILETGAAPGNTVFTVAYDGTIYQNGGTVLNSDRKLKKNIQSLENQSQQILLLNPVSFNWKAKTSAHARQFGLIAQEVEEVFPDLVFQDQMGRKGVNYSGLIAPLIASIKEQQAIIEKQERQLKDLKELVCIDHPLAEFCQN